MDGVRAVPPPAHLLLRDSTRAAHDAAEASAGMRRLLSGELDEAGYRGLLAAQWELFREWEAERADWLEAVNRTTGWSYASRANALKADLTTVGAHPVRDISSREARSFPDTSASSARAVRGTGAKGCRAQGALLPGDAAAWGELYVIEGSALGGQVIVRHLRERFPRLPHHFYAMGEQATPPWRRFQAILDTALADEDDRGDAVNGALRMFARFQQSLQDDPRHV